MKQMVFLLLLIASFAKAQSIQDCNLERCLNTENIYVLNNDNLHCLVENKNKTIFYSYAFWCKPCVEHLPNVIEFCEENNVNLFVLLIHKEDSKETRIENNRFKNDSLKVLILSDDYGKRPRKKYKNFLQPFYPNSDIIDDMSKIILFDESGNLMYISDWMDGPNVLSEKILSLINQ